MALALSFSGLQVRATEKSSPAFSTSISSLARAGAIREWNSSSIVHHAVKYGKPLTADCVDIYVYVISRARVLYLIYVTEPEGREARGRGHVN